MKKVPEEFMAAVKETLNEKFEKAKAERERIEAILKEPREAYEKAGKDVDAAFHSISKEKNLEYVDKFRERVELGEIVGMTLVGVSHDGSMIITECPAPLAPKLHFSLVQAAKSVASEWDDE